VVIVVVVVVVMSLSGSAYMGRQMSRRDEEFNQIHVVWNTSLMSMLSLKWRWRSTAHLGHDRS